MSAASKTAPRWAVVAAAAVASCTAAGSYDGANGVAGLLLTRTG
jgi:hypothetical protein